MTFGRLLIALACGPLVLIVLACAEANWICVSEARYVSSRERIAAAVAYAARDIKGLAEKPMPDDIDAFIRDNPGCCSIEAGGAFDGWVHLVFELKPHRISQSQPNDVAYDAFVFVNACGAKAGFNGMPVRLDVMRSLTAHVRQNE